MGYAAQKKKTEEKKKRLKRVAVIVAAVLIAALCVLTAFYPASSWKYYFALPKVQAIGEGEMRIHFLSVGESDATIVEFPDGKKMLIDGGDSSEKSAETVLRYLNALKIKTLDYLVVTSVKNDRTGALDKVLSYKEVKRAILPKAEGDAGTEYAEAYVEITKRNIPFDYALNSLIVSEAEYGYTFAVLSPNRQVTEEEVENDAAENSAVLWFSCQDVSALLCGDVSATRLNTLVSADKIGVLQSGVSLVGTQIVKVADNGKSGAVNAATLAYLQAETAIVSCGNNPYKPAEDTLQTLADCGLETLRTDESGHIVLTIKEGKYEVTAN